MDRELTPRDRSKRRLARWSGPALLAAAAAVALMWLGGALEPSAELSRLRIATVARGDLEAVLTAAGTVQPAAERVLASPVDARLLRVLHQPGSRVRPGDALVQLDLSATEAELAQLDGRLDQARSMRVERRLQLDKEVLELGGRRRIKELELEEALFQLEQQERLHQEGLLSLASLRGHKTRARRLEIELEGLLASQGNAEASAAAQLGGLDAELRSLSQERAQLARLLERAASRAERAGVVTWVLDDEGATVRAGDPLARLADLGSFHLQASVSDVHAGRVSAGQPVRVPLGEHRLSGHISRVLPAVEQGTVRFWVALDEPGHEGLRPNLRLDVLVVTATRSDVLTVAAGPFAGGPGAQEVFVLGAGEDRAFRRTITLGVSGNRSFEVTAGLEEGERVIVSDLSRFAHLDTIRLR